MDNYGIRFADWIFIIATGDTFIVNCQLSIVN